MPAPKDPKKKEEWKKKISLSLKGKPSWNKGLTKETDERIRLSAEKPCWRTGLTAETDPRVRRNAESNRGKHFYRKGMSYEEEYGEERAKEIKKKIGQRGIGRPAWNRGLTMETDERVRINTENRKGYKHSEETKKVISVKAREGYENGRIPYMKGKVPTEETRQKSQNVAIKRYKEHPETHLNYILSRNKGRMTKIEKLTKEFFERLGFKMGEDFIYQYLVACSRGTRWIDFYFPKLKLGIECDGSYWHQDKEKDKKRDEEILKVLGEDSIIERLTEKEIFSLRYLQGVKHV